MKHIEQPDDLNVDTLDLEHAYAVDCRSAGRRARRIINSLHTRRNEYVVPRIADACPDRGIRALAGTGPYGVTVYRRSEDGVHSRPLTADVSPYREPPGSQGVLLIGIGGHVRARVPFRWLVALHVLAGDANEARDRLRKVRGRTATTATATNAHNE